MRTHHPNSHVVIAGAGPVGLWLAAELRLGGARVTVLEARPEPSPHSKALTVHPRTLEVLAMRGAVEPFLAEGLRIPDGHYGALDQRLDFSVLDTPYPFTLALPQVRTEALLEERARAAGADIRRGHRLTGLAEHASGVRVDAAGPEGAYGIEAAYVVGCDGTRSTVRAAADIDFPGTDATVWGWLGDVVLDRPPARPALSASTPRGGVMCVRMPDGVHRFVGHGPEGQRADRPGEFTFDELRAAVLSVVGDDFGMRDPRWLSRFGNATRQAATYRKGRVLLAGDAAHMHFPAGGVGLNVGVQDATNLGWKLAAVLRGTAPDALLDTYHSERHPVGAELVTSTRAQTALMTAYSAEGRALREVLGSAVATVPAFSRRLADGLSGLGVAYATAYTDTYETRDGGGDHPLTGRRAPNLRLGPGVRLFDLLREGRPVLLDFAGQADGPSADVLVHQGPPVGDRADWAGVGSALIRPDGHVGWARDAAARPGRARGAA
ncbi:FAD-dependent monooxygenase [Streptomyces sp. NRRL B-1347]|uniref:FAD-dependent monooxygenase n=1 Tax=Streptomyces sp. NRRL B-1347 TaxID=1476877 RepID=UPI00055F4756|nr:FAD-dependent monooxygenase [Streptomyces sp. NRRL B-1347]